MWTMQVEDGCLGSKQPQQRASGQLGPQTLEDPCWNNPGWDVSFQGDVGHITYVNLVIPAEPAEAILFKHAN